MTQSIYRSAAGEQAVVALYDRALAQWPVVHETRMVPTRHGETFVILSGRAEGPPLVLLHGAGTNSAIWAGDVAAYGRSHRVIAVDLPGEAGRSTPNRPAWDGPAFTEWLEDVLDVLRVERAVLVGISQGAWTALKFAVVHPQRVEQLVLLTPGGIVPDRLSFVLRAGALSFLGDWGARRMTRMLYGRQPIPDGVEEITAVVMRHFKARIGVLPIFTDEQLQRLTMPVLLLGGSDDALRDMDKIAGRLDDLLPQMEVVIVPGAGHALLDTSEQVLTVLGRAQPA